MNLSYEERRQLGHDIMDYVYAFKEILLSDLVKLFPQINEIVLILSIKSLEQMQFIIMEENENNILVSYRPKFARDKR